MSKIKLEDFVNNVEFNRKELVKHCLANGESVSESDSLDYIVLKNSQIGNEPTNKFKVEFKDLDGNYFAPTQYVNAGESATIPNGYPELDPDLLEFDYWAVSGGDDLSNVQRDILCLPQYKTKYREDLGQRPTYLVCYFEESALSPTFYDSSSYAKVNMFIDWGDGTEPQNITSSTITHTYPKEGLYIITVYGDDYGFGGSSSGGIFNNATYSPALIKAYLGENFSFPSTGSSPQMFRTNRSLIYAVIPKLPNGISAMFMECRSLRSFVVSEGVETSMAVFDGCYSLKSVVLPKTLEYISGLCNYCENLVNIILPSSATFKGTSMFSRCKKLEKIELPKGVTKVTQSCFQDCTSLESIIIPDGVIELVDACFSGAYRLSKINIPSTIKNISSTAFTQCTGLNEIVLYDDFDISLNIMYSTISEECLLDIAKKLKNNVGLTTKTLSLSGRKCKQPMRIIMVNEFGDRVPNGTEGATTLLEFVQNKNWTVTFSETY